MKNRKIIISVIFLFSLILGMITVSDALSSNCEPYNETRHDDMELCDPAGDSCVVVWGCPDDK